VERSVSSTSVAAAEVVTVPRLTAHVMDAVSGRPAEGLMVRLFKQNQSGTWSSVADRYPAVFNNNNNNNKRQFVRRRNMSVDITRAPYRQSGNVVRDSSTETRL